MQMEAPGYLRPQVTGVIPDSAERRIASVCPGLRQDVQAGDRTNDPLWGPYMDMKVGWANQSDLRFTGASGGALSALVSFLITSGKVDAAIETAAHDETPIANKAVVAQTVDEVRAAAGSRYAPSAPLADLPKYVEDYKATGRRFAFVGKPCDVAALRALQQHDDDLQKAIPYVLSFFCAGVPSQEGAEEVLKALGTSLDEVTSFRYRGNGWPGSATAITGDGTARSMSYHDSWGKILSKHVQHRCKICADGTGVAADIACADAWEADEAGYPIFGEADGISLVVARTPLGLDLLQEATNRGALSVQDFDVSQLAAIQPGQRERRRAVLARLLALRLVRCPTPKYDGLLLAAAARQNPASRNLKNFLGMLRRVLRARLRPN